MASLKPREIFNLAAKLAHREKTAVTYHLYGSATSLTGNYLFAMIIFAC